MTRLVCIASIACVASVAWTGAGAAAWLDVTDAAGAHAVPDRGQHGFTSTPDGTLYVFGGARQYFDGKTRRFGFLGDFWRQAPGASFTDLTTASACPIPPTIEAHLASDSTGRIYEFGGIQGDLQGWFSHALYRFDPATMRWENLTPADTTRAPLGREDHGFVADWKRDRLWLFGGITQRDSLLDDLWCYDVAAERWSRVPPLASSPRPSPRELYDLVWDGHDALYLFGGWNVASGYLNDFWRYDIPANTWTDLTDASGSRAIAPRSYVGIAADPNGVLWLAGGYAAPAAQGGFWRYDARGGVWTPVDDAVPEAFLPRVTYEMVFRPCDDALYVFGGMVTPAFAPREYRADVWRFPLRPAIRSTASEDAGGGTYHLTVDATSAAGAPLEIAWMLGDLPIAGGVTSADVGPLCPGAHEARVIVRDGSLADTARWSLDARGEGDPDDHVRDLTAEVDGAVSPRVRWTIGGNGRADAFRVSVRPTHEADAWTVIADVPVTQHLAPSGEGCVYSASLAALARGGEYAVRVASLHAGDGGEVDSDEVSVFLPASSFTIALLPRGGGASGWTLRVSGARAGSLIRATILDAAGRSVRSSATLATGAASQDVLLAPLHRAGAYRVLVQSDDLTGRVPLIAP